MSFNIVGTGSALPKRIVTNDELSTFLETNDEWISDRTGIRERRVVTDESISELAAQAARNALEAATANAGIGLDDVDMIIATTSVYDYRFPSLAYRVHELLGAPEMPAFDVNAVCTGFVTALEMADTYIRANKANTILIVSAEEMSRVMDWADRNTCVLFGDGAGSVVVTRAPEGAGGYLGGLVSGTGSAAPLYSMSPLGNSPWNTADASQSPYTQMIGRDVFKFAVNAIVRSIEQVLEITGKTPEDVDHYLLHQANKRIIAAAATRFGTSEDRVPTNIESYGNTSSASLPLLLDEQVRAGLIPDGDICVFSAFGAGLMSGACVLQFNKTNRLLA